MFTKAKIFLSFLIVLSGFSIAQEAAQIDLNEVFANRAEQYFRFSLESKDQIENLSKLISIDKVEEKTVFAYANRAEFEAFLQQNIPYQLLNPPNYLFEAEMYNSGLKQTYAWDQYLNYTDYINLMYQFASNYPAICQVFSIGQSVNGRELLVAKISDNISTKENEPQFFYSGQIHGDELVTSILMLRLIDHLTANYNTDNQVTELVNNIEIWINPLANPDGLYAGGNTTVAGAIRYNANSVDLNRNFPDPQDGSHPDGKTWQVETQAFMNLATAQNFVMSANTHAGAAVVNYPWDTWYTRHADDDWWQLVSFEYANTAQYYSPAGYMESFNDGITNGYDWYTISGGRQDYMNYFQNCREVTIEQSVQKFLPASELPAYWDYNRQAMLNYLQQVTFGFRGKITDFDSGLAIEAKVEIENHDNNNSFVFANSLGNYYRPIKAGTYNLIFSAEGYQSKTILNESILDYQSKIIDVALQKLDLSIDSPYKPIIEFSNPVQNSVLRIISPVQIHKMTVFSILGQAIQTVENENQFELVLNTKNLTSGLYIFVLQFSNGKASTHRFLVP
jgi:murein tripeptide amidase MpaA